MEHKRRLAPTIVWILVSLVLAACNSSQVVPTQILPTPTPVPTATPIPTIQPGESERTLMVDDRERSYLLYIPPGLDSQQSVPVIFAFHGFTQSPTMPSSDFKTRIGKQIALAVRGGVGLRRKFQIHNRIIPKDDFVWLGRNVNPLEEI